MYVCHGQVVDNHHMMLDPQIEMHALINWELTHSWRVHGQSDRAIRGWQKCLAEAKVNTNANVSSEVTRMSIVMWTYGYKSLCGI